MTHRREYGVKHRGEYFFYYSESSRREKTGWVRLRGKDFRSLISAVPKLVGGGRETPVWVQDLCRIACAVHLADRRAARRSSPDRWTRVIHLSVEVGDPSLWQPEVISTLTSMLRVLTADEWLVEVYGGAPPIDAAILLDDMPSVDGFDAVVLLSGGLDSAAYTLDLASRGGVTMYLLSFYLDRHRQPQEAILDEIDRLLRSDYVHSRVNPQVRGSADESNRSRGFLFAAFAVLVATAFNVTSVRIPENGQVAINPSLTPARAASCSTKSVHPWVLWQLNRLIEALGGDVRVVNPLLYLTKGEVCAIARDALQRIGSDAERVLAGTISCGNRSVNRPHHNNCGSCFPCLVRRSGLHAALGADPTTYAATPQDPDDTLADLVDLRCWLETPFTTRDLLAEAPLPPDVDVDRLMDMLHRGREELRAMLDHTFPAWNLAGAGGR